MSLEINSNSQDRSGSDPDQSESNKADREIDKRKELAIVGVLLLLQRFRKSFRKALDQTPQRITPSVRLQLLGVFDPSFSILGRLEKALGTGLATQSGLVGKLARAHLSRWYDIDPRNLRAAEVLSRSPLLTFGQITSRYSLECQREIKRQLQIGLFNNEDTNELTRRIARLGPGFPATPNGAARSLEHRFRAWAERIVETEIQRAYNVAAHEAIREMAKQYPGVTRRWDATPDGSTCKRCASLHGSIVAVEGLFPGGILIPPAHPRCRCRVLPVFNG